MRATLTQFSNIYLSYPNGGYTTMGSENQYHADGRLRYARDLQDGNFDRAFDYDHAGRLKEAYTGREARGLSPNNPADSPFRQSYTYDARNNLSRTGRHWTAPVSDTPAYTNNRRADWTYDANGSVTSRDSGQRTHAYDAAGQQRNFHEEGLQVFSGESWVSHQYTINQTYDAAGRAGKRIETRHSEDENGTLEDSTETSYQLRSTVLGGALNNEIDQWGGREGHVYAGGELLADYQYYPAPNTFTSIHHRNPTTGQWVENGVRTELDPLGADVSYVNPYLYNLTYSDIMGADNLYYRRGNALDIRGGCSLNGLSIPCSLANEAIAAETGSVAFEYRLNDGTVVGEQGAIRNLGAGLFLFDHPLVELDNEPGDDPYRLAWRTGSFYLLPQITPQKQSCTFNVNVSGIRLSKAQLKSIGAEMNRLLSPTGHKITINSASDSDATYNLMLTHNTSSALREDRNNPHVVGYTPLRRARPSDPGYTDANLFDGRVPGERGYVYMNRPLFTNVADTDRRLTIAARVGVHELLHYLLQTRTHGGGIMREGIPDYDKDDADFSIDETYKSLLDAWCNKK